MSPFLERLRFTLGRLSRRISRVGEVLIRPIDWLFHTISQKMVGASERAEELFALAASVVTWPFRRIWRSTVTLFRRIRPKASQDDNPGAIDRIVRAASHRMVTATEGVERVEGIFVFLGRAITWPLRTLWRGPVALARWILPASVRASLRESLDAFSKRLHTLSLWFVRAAEAIDLDGALLWFAWLTQPIWRPIAAIGGLFYTWAATRDYRQALWGLPALILLLPFVLILSHTVVFGQGGFASKYKVAVKKAAEDGDYERVELFERKLAQLGVDTKRSDFMTAVAVAKDEKMAEAYRRMQRLAPIDEPGHPSAHFWIIRHLARADLEVPPDESQRLIGVHLDHLATLGSEGPDLQMLRAGWLSQGDQLAEAAAILEPLVANYSEAAIDRMRIHVALKRTDNAREDALTVRTHMQDQTRRTKQLTTHEYQSWALAESLLGDRRNLKAVLQTWHDWEPENEQAQGALVELLKAEFERRVQNLHPDADALANLLLDSFDLSGDRMWLQDQANSLFQTNDRSWLVESVTQRVLESDRSTSNALEILGTAAATSRKWNQAEPLLAKAIEKNPKNAVAWNNQAWVLSRKPMADQEKAIEAVETAMQIRRDDFRFHETRGQIWLRLKRWEDAINDLEFASNGIPGSHEIHEALADAYDALGNSELAQIHRERTTGGNGE